MSLSCKGQTKTKLQCKNKTKNAEGYCRLHLNQQEHAGDKKEDAVPEEKGFDDRKEDVAHSEESLPDKKEDASHSGKKKGFNDKHQCEGICKSGKRCSKNAVSTKKYCRMHEALIYKFVYSRSKKTVTIFKGGKIIDEMALQVFGDLYILPYMNYAYMDGGMRKNPYNLQKADADYFFSKGYIWNRDYTGSSGYSNSSYTQPPPTQSSKQLLDSLGITSNKDYKKWIVKNHPDKNSSTEDSDLLFKSLFERVKEAMTKVYNKD